MPYGDSLGGGSTLVVVGWKRGAASCVAGGESETFGSGSIASRHRPQIQAADPSPNTMIHGVERKEGRFMGVTRE